MSANPILVTGASGFVATHIVEQLQRAGHRVRGTVRSLLNEEKVAPLKNLCPDAKYPLELFEADLTKPDSWNRAIQGCEYVIHVASPLPSTNPRDPDEIIKPAVDGTLSVLRACKDAGGVKRVVLTGSMAAVTDGTKSGSFSEEDWQDADKTPLAYYKSKSLAEKAAWDFVENLPDDEKFELSVVNPGLIIGPVLCGSWATSMEFPKRLMQKEIPALPRCNYAVVDVRDVAAAHIKAMTLPEAAGKRHLLTSGNVWVKNMAEILSEEFKPLGYKIPTKEAPMFAVRVMSMFDKSIKLILPVLGKVATFDNTRMTSVLGVQPRSPKESLVDMGYSMIEKGFVKKTKKYKEVKEGSK